MYEYLRGRVVSRSAARVVLEVQGVAYDLAVPLGTELSGADDVCVWTHLVVREDAHLLYGFADRETRELFRLLLSVRGVGPGVALVVLSGLPRAALVDAILAGDAARLMALKGIGKKTADQILLDLRDKAQLLRAAEAAPALVRATPEQANVVDAIQALVSVGYAEKEAKRSVERAARESGASDLATLVRAALSG